MYCNYCGAELDGRKCGNCGAIYQPNSKRIVRQVDLGTQVFECRCGTSWESTEYTQKKDYNLVSEGGFFNVLLRNTRKVFYWHLNDGCPNCNRHGYKKIDIE